MEVAAYVTAALVIGISKTSIGGFGVIGVMLFALVMPARESTAAVLLLLIVGDLVAVWRYRRHCDWALLRRLLPYVVPGIILGAVFINLVDDHVLKRSIGAILTLFVLAQIVQRVRARRARAPQPLESPADGSGPDSGDAPAVARRASRAMEAMAGTAAGFTTMTANAAGPVMTLYLLAAGVDKRAFVGTGAWFFLIVNLTKVPFSAALGLFPESTLRIDLLLVPVVLIGTAIGTRIVSRVSQPVFEFLALAASAFSAVVLLVT